MQFSDFAFAEPINRAIAEMGYVVPTPIQAQAIPVVLQGEDVMGVAQTGTGKTAGFALPILQRLLVHANQSVSPARHPVRALMLAPTRELADQIYANVRDYAKYTPLRVSVVFGGVDIKPQLASLRQGCELLIATPGRLLDHVEQKSLVLTQIQALVLDEADRMLDMGFLPDIHRIIRLLPAERQNLMFSATFSPEIRKLAETYLHQPKLIEVARRNALAENVEQTVYRVESEAHKRIAVSRLLRDRGLSQVIVFTNTKIAASRLARDLVREGLSADAIHGDKSQQDRLATLEGFKQAKVAVLVATDVAARGLDIAELPAVINFDLPYSPEDYVHRIGRTGRAGASGIALSLMAPGDERYLSEIEKLTKRKFDVQSLSVARQDDLSAEASADALLAVRLPSPRAAQAASRSRLPGFSNDPFFFKPYEPEGMPPASKVDSERRAVHGAANVEVAATHRAAASSTSTLRKPAKPLAALLGGKTRAEASS